MSLSSNVCSRPSLWAASDPWSVGSSCCNITSMYNTSTSTSPACPTHQHHQHVQHININLTSMSNTSTSPACPTHQHHQHVQHINITSMSSNITCMSSTSIIDWLDRLVNKLSHCHDYNELLDIYDWLKMTKQLTDSINDLLTGLTD